MKKKFEKEKSIIIILFCFSIALGLLIGSGLGYFALYKQLKQAEASFEQCRELYNKNCVTKIDEWYLTYINNTYNITVRIN